MVAGRIRPDRLLKELRHRRYGWCGPTGQLAWGACPREAVHRGALERLAPILMTALAAGLALIPLALAGGEPGSEIQTPMAIVILFGLLSSTALNMLVVPALYLRFGQAVRALDGKTRSVPE